MPFGAGHWPYLFIILVIVLIIWGPGKLPELGSGLGKAIREFRKASTEVRDQVMTATAPETPAAPPAAVAPPAPVQAAPPAPQPPVEHPTA